MLGWTAKSKESMPSRKEAARTPRLGPGDVGNSSRESGPIRASENKVFAHCRCIWLDLKSNICLSEAREANVGISYLVKVLDSVTLMWHYLNMLGKCAGWNSQRSGTGGTAPLCRAVTSDELARQRAERLAGRAGRLPR